MQRIYTAGHACDTCFQTGQLAGHSRQLLNVMPDRTDIFCDILSQACDVISEALHVTRGGFPVLPRPRRVVLSPNYPEKNHHNSIRTPAHHSSKKQVAKFSHHPPPSARTATQNIKRVFKLTERPVEWQHATATGLLTSAAWQGGLGCYPSSPLCRIKATRVPKKHHQRTSADAARRYDHGDFWSVCDQQHSVPDRSGSGDFRQRS
jgi:hypothetical protein